MSSSTFRLIDSGGFRKLEQAGPFTIIRPAAAAVWPERSDVSGWREADAEFVRNREGGGEWKIRNAKIKEAFWIEIEEIRFKIKLTSFGHLGIFPEQLRHWLLLEKWMRTQKAAGRASKVLNLFAYTGGSTLFCARGGAEVAHVDASQGTVKWARENAEGSGLAQAPIRWLVDDVKEFVAREIRRGTKYNAVILDPPSYGKGEKRQVWKIEKDLIQLLFDLKKILDPDGETLVCLSAHTEGFTPVSLTNQLTTIFGGGRVEAGEMLIADQFGRPLPSGAGAVWTSI